LKLRATPNSQVTQPPCTKISCGRLLKKTKSSTSSPDDIQQYTYQCVKEHQTGDISNNGGKIIIMRCNQNGQIYVELMGTKPTEVLSSLKLK